MRHRLVPTEVDGVPRGQLPGLQITEDSAKLIGSEATVPRPLIGVALLNYNNAADTIECLKSLIESPVLGQGAIALVDNASPDDSAQVLRTWLAQNIDASRWCEIGAGRGSADAAKVVGKVVFHAHEFNDGYGAGNNIALSMLREASPAWYWILNNDTVIAAEELRRLVRELQTRPARAEIVGTRIHTVGTSGANDIIGGGVLQRLLGRTVANRERMECRGKRGGRIDYIAGASMLISA